MRDLSRGPSELEDDDETGIVDHLGVLVAVLAADAPEEDEGEGEDDAEGAEQVPRLATAELSTEPVVVAAVGREPDEHGRHAVGDLPDEEDDAGIDVVEFEDFVEVKLKQGSLK